MRLGTQPAANPSTSVGTITSTRRGRSSNSRGRGTGAAARPASVPRPSTVAAIQIVALRRTSKDYRRVSDEFQKTCSKRIVQIEHVHHTPQRESYRVYCEHSVAPSNHGDPNEKWLFHGTDGDTIKKITTGVNQSFVRGSIYYCFFFSFGPRGELDAGNAL
jgi:hypothetical protein